MPAAPAHSTTSNTDDCAADLGAPDRRLTRFELAHAVEDVFGVDASSLHALPGPAASIGDVPDILVGRLLDTSPRFLTPYRAAIAKLAAAAGARLAPACNAPDPASARRCVVEQLRLPAARLWRASLNAQELAELDAAGGAATAPAALFQLGILHLLGSPRFYLLKNEAPAKSADREDPHRFATRRLLGRLSLALWSSVPDSTLLERAERGALADDGEFEAELRRMIDDPRFARFAREFTRQWLRLDRRPLFRPSLESRSLSNDPARLARAHDEVTRFLARQLATERPLSELLTSLDPDLNPASTRPAERAGLLTSQALLSAVSTPIRGGGDESWLGRGLVVQSAFLCRTFPLAAVYPSELWEAHALLDPRLTAASPRPGEPALLSIRTTDKPCRECHRQLETIGATLSVFDGLGEPRAASAPPVEVAGQQIAGPTELSSWILRSGRFEPCVAQKLLSYVLGRAVLPAQRTADRCLVERLTAGRDSPATLRRWLLQSLMSPGFRAQGEHVIRDKPTPSPNSNGYTDPLLPLSVKPAACQSFDAGAFLVGNCGTAACHGAGAPSAAFAVADAETAARLLRSSKPSPAGYCGNFAHYLDPEQPSNSLVVRKLTGGAGLCGAAMPITGGPRTLAPVEHACFINWVTEHARRGR